jgi:hypothetical protein
VNLKVKQPFSKGCEALKPSDDSLGFFVFADDLTQADKTTLHALGLSPIISRESLSKNL